MSTKLTEEAIATGVCWRVSLSLILWWRPASRRHMSTGYVREGKV